MASESINIDELEQSRSQAATTASQTVKISKQVVSDHNTSTTAHQDLRNAIVPATSEQAGLVYIDETVTKTDVSNAVPNVAGLINYIKDTVGEAIHYAGQINIGDSSIVVGQTFYIKGNIRKGAMYRFIGGKTDKIEYNDHTYRAEDYIIANTTVSGTSDYKAFTIFDWYNVQDIDVVKKEEVQTLTNKTLTDTSNIFRKAQSRNIDGTVYIANSFADAKTDEKSGKYDLLTTSALQDELDKRLLVSRKTVTAEDGSEVSTFIPVDNDSNLAYLNSSRIFNLKDIIVTFPKVSDKEEDLTVDFKIPSKTEYANIGTTEYLATMSYVDNKDISDFLKENKPVVQPIFVNSEFNAYRQDGTLAQTSTTTESTGGLSKTFLQGYKVTFTSNFKWVHNDKNFDPTCWDIGTFTTDPATPDKKVLPASGAASTVKLLLGTTSSFVTTDRTGTITYYAPKTGLVVDNGNVKKADGDNISSNTAKITFYQEYYGLWSKNTTITATDIKAAKALTHSVQTTPSMTISGITYPGTDDQFYFIAYPSTWADITTLKGTKDGNTADYKDSFEKLENTVAVTNDAGLVVNYKIYRSKDMSSYAGFTFTIS